MAVDLGESFLVKSSNHRQVNIFERDDWIRRPVYERMVPLVIHAIDGGRIIGVGSRHNHARNLHDVELEPGGVEPRYRLRGRNQHLLPLMPADLAARPLIFDVNRADFAFDEFLGEIADMMLAAMTRVAVRNDQWRVERGGRILLALRGGHPDSIGPLNLVLMQQSTHP